VRALRATPGFTAVAILTLGLGVGANTAVFSLLDALLFQRLPVVHPEQLRSAVVVSTAGEVMSNVPSEFFDELRREPRAFAGVMACWRTEMNLDSGGDPERVLVQYVSGSYYSTLGVPMYLGHPITPADETSDERVAVVSYRFWQRRLGADPSVLGRTVRLNGVAATVVGVTPATFFGVDRGVAPEITIPLPKRSPFTNLWVTARLAANATDGDAEAEANLALRRALETIRPRLGRYRSADREWMMKLRAGLRPADKGVGAAMSSYIEPLRVLLLLSAAVLLIACINVANLLLARALARTHEFGVRMALGASRSRLFRQVLAESVVLAALGSAAGLAIATLMHPLLVRLLMYDVPHKAIAFEINAHLLAFGFTIATITVLIFGVVPAVRATRATVSASLLAGAPRGSRQRHMLAKALVVAQVGAALVLLLGAGLLVRSFRTLNALETGVSLDRMLTMRIGFSARETQRTEATEVYTELVRRVEAIPGVVSAALGWDSALASGNAGKSIWVEGQPPESSQSAGFNVVGPGFFATAAIPVLAGREFTQADAAGSRKVVIVSEAWVRRYAGGRNPIGLHMGDEGAGSVGKYEVIGVVKDARTLRLRRPAGPMIYQPLLQDDWASNVVLHVRTREDPWALYGRVRAAIRGLNSRLPVYDVTTLSDRHALALGQDRMMAVLSGGLGVIALFLTLLGVYGIIAYSVVQRRVELGVRMALGATDRAVRSLIVAETLKLATLGVGVGIPLSLAAASVLKSMLFGVTPQDLATLLVSITVLLVAAMIAGYLPARRAARIPPAIALRAQ
jgi:predicted permease